MGLSQINSTCSQLFAIFSNQGIIAEYKPGINKEPSPLSCRNGLPILVPAGNQLANAAVDLLEGDLVVI